MLDGTSTCFRIIWGFFMYSDASRRRSATCRSLCLLGRNQLLVSGTTRGIPHFHPFPTIPSLRNSDGFGLSTIPVQGCRRQWAAWKGGGGILDDLDFFILR